MELSLGQHEWIRDYLPVQRGNVEADNYVMLNALTSFGIRE
jgi:hypothetical protein